MGEFVQEHRDRSATPLFGGQKVTATVPDREAAVIDIFPSLRGAVSSNRRVIGHYDGSEDAIGFANSHWAEDLCRMGTSCPDHFLRTRISPMFIPWNPGEENLTIVKERIAERITTYRDDYAAYYKAFAEPDSPRLRDSNPSVVVIPGLGLFGFGKDKREARITTEFFVNAIHVMAGANALGSAEPDSTGRRRAAGPAAGTGRAVQDVQELRRAAAPRSVSHRILGARRGKASADAARA